MRKKVLQFVFVGGIIGLSIHLVWHFSTKTQLIYLGPHIIDGALFTGVGMIVGAIFFLISKR